MSLSVLENIKKQLNVSNLYLILFFLYSLRIFGIQDEILWVWAVIGILYFVVRQKKLLLGFQGVILCVITPVYALVYKYYFTEIRGYTWKDAIYMIFLPVFMYILSRQFAYKKKEKMLELGLWCIAAGTFFYSLLNHWMYLKYGFPWGGRISVEFWSGDAIYATESSFWAVFITALAGYGICCLLRREWGRGIAAWAGVIIGNIINVQIKNRMVFMTALVAAVISLGMFFILNRKNGKAVWRAVIALAVVLLAAAAVYYGNLEEIQQSSFYLSVINRDGGILHNVRFDMIIDSLRQIPQNLTGGGHIHPAGYYAVHNYWLQVASDTGIVTFILWIIYNILVIIDAIRLVFIKNIDSKVKYMVIPMIAAVAAYMMMEQAGTGKWYYVNFYVMLAAMMHQMIQNKKREKQNADSKVLRRSRKSDV